MHKVYDPHLIESKWQKHWEKHKVFRTKADPKRKKYYILEMLPYPSGRLHMGHVRNYSIGDVVARYHTMRGINVLHPIGWDAFGMPAENAAIQRGVHPAEWTFSNIESMKQQMKRLGFSYDWEREVATCVPEYYKWEQLVFVRMFEKGLIERKESFVNWCDKCATVLANEQVVNGLCWRCDGKVRLQSMTQWYCKTPKYAEELLKDIDTLEGWPERVKTMQREWIGKSVGTMIKFPLLCKEGSGEVESIEVFTTRPDTLFGATFMSLASEHPMALALSAGKPEEAEVRKFIEEVAHMDRMKRLEGDYEKKGVFTGSFCTNPVTGSKMPIYVANFVLMDYGTGAVMAVPTHDQRDFEFAKKYKLPMKIVIVKDSKSSGDPSPAAQDDKAASEMTEAYVDEGVLVNSGEFDGLNNLVAIEKISDMLEKKGIGKRTVHYRLKDWCISRQRYWGAPIPIIYCEKCGVVPVPEKDLPVELPHDVAFTGVGGSPLAKSESFVNCKCPKCKAKAKRETDTLDTFVESSWYFLRYCSPRFDKGIVDVADAKYWMPIDHYIGGIEHAVGHLMYCRFYMKVLRDLGLVKFSETNEPAVNLLTQGMVIKDGSKMSKSKGNTVDPDEMIEKFGADTARMFLLFASPPEKDLDWSEQGVEGCFRFLSRVWRLVANWQEVQGAGCRVQGSPIDKIMHKTIKRVTDDIERFHFNTAISAIMEYVNALYQADLKDISEENINALVLMIAPFAPHMAEEIWQELGNKDGVYKAQFPQFDAKMIADEDVLVVVQVNGKLRDRLTLPSDINEEDAKKLALASEKVIPYLEGKQVRKVIYVPKKLVSIVVS